MSTLGNIFWFILCGLPLGIGWFFAGIFWCITIIGIPVGIQCFKFAKLSFFPFGKEIHLSSGTGDVLLNIIWLILTGLPMAGATAIIGLIFCITLIGIPFGLQCFKMAKLFLMPFGAEIVDSNTGYTEQVVRGIRQE